MLLGRFAHRFTQSMFCIPFMISHSLVFGFASLSFLAQEVFISNSPVDQHTK